MHWNIEKFVHIDETKGETNFIYCSKGQNNTQLSDNKRINIGFQS